MTSVLKSLNLVKYRIFLFLIFSGNIYIYMYFKYDTILRFLNGIRNSETYSRSYLIINLEKRKRETRETLLCAR